MVAGAQPFVGRLAGIEERHASHRNFGPIDGGQVSSQRRLCERGQTDDRSVFPLTCSRGPLRRYTMSLPFYAARVRAI